MTKIKLSCFYILFMTLCFTPLTFAAFNDIGVGARPLGLGGAFVALADDSNAPNYNAAGLAYIEEIQIGATYAQRFSGLHYLQHDRRNHAARKCGNTRCKYRYPYRRF